MTIEIVTIDQVPDRSTWRQFTAEELESDIRSRFKELYGREPEHIYEVRYPNNTFYLVGPVLPEEKNIRKGEQLND